MIERRRQPPRRYRDLVQLVVTIASAAIAVLVVMLDLVGELVKMFKSPPFS